MATRKTVTKVPYEPEIHISGTDAARILELYDGMIAADAHYQRCQSDAFRQFVAGNAKAETVGSAFESLRAAIEKATGPTE